MEREEKKELRARPAARFSVSFSECWSSVTVNPTPETNKNWFLRILARILRASGRTLVFRLNTGDEKRLNTELALGALDYYL
jgi:hypothetical protein